MDRFSVGGTSGNGGLSIHKITKKETEKLGDEIERILPVIIHNPAVFPLSDKGKVRKATILKYNAMYYRIVENEIQILSFFSNRQNPDSRKI